MKRAAVLLGLMLAAGCGASGLTIANGIGLGAQTAVLACDWGQTRRAAEMGWVYKRMLLEEESPILGRTPSPAAVDLYFLGAIAATALAWRLLPRRWRLTVPVVVVALQAQAITHNLGRGGIDLGICGVR